MEPVFLQQVWFVLISFFLLGYSILDGFDLGIGSLMPVLAKGEKDSRILYTAIAPFWDGNEVWLLTAGAALFASFPPVYATVFSGFYLAMMLVLFALIFRAVSIEFYFHDQKRKNLWRWTFIVGSFLPSLLFGIALGNVIMGVPLDNQSHFSGHFFTLLRPFPLMIGLLGLNAILLQGSTYATLKTDLKLRQRAIKASKYLWGSFMILFLVSMAASFIYLPEASKKYLPWIFSILVVIVWLMLRINIKRGKDGRAFMMSCLLFTGLWAIAGTVHFPNLLKASNNPALTLSIYNSSSSALTLKVMLIIAVLGMPLVLFYTYYVYKTFKGKVSEEESLY